MNIDELFTPILQIFLITLRVGAVWMTFPVLSQNNIPSIVKLSGALALAVALHPAIHANLPPWSATQLPTLANIVYVVSRELIIGLGMGFVAKWIFTSAMAAANWAGMQMGFSAGSILNPETESQESGWAEFHSWVAILLFLGIGGHWLLIRALADSYQIDFSQIFTSLTDPKLSGAFWIEIGRTFFLWMLKLSAPIVVVTLLLQAAMGVLSRFVPQINVWLVSLPITIGAGVIVFTMLSPLYGDALESLMNATQSSSLLWLKMLKGGG